MKFTLISYLIILVVMIFALNKFVSFSSQLQDKVLGAYMKPMEEINKTSGMEVYNLDKQASYTQEELEMLKEIY